MCGKWPRRTVNRSRGKLGSVENVWWCSPGKPIFPLHHCLIVVPNDDSQSNMLVSVVSQPNLFFNDFRQLTISGSNCLKSAETLGCFDYHQVGMFTQDLHYETN